MLLDYLKKIPDTRTKTGRMFDLPHILLFSILAIASGADSYRKIAIYIEENFETFQETYSMNWKRAPSYNSIRHIIQSLDQKETERIFRQYALFITPFEKDKGTLIALDGKALKHSFDTVADTRFKQILSAFSPDHNIILAHKSIGVDKENEINSAVEMLKELAIPHMICTLNALHTQKKPYKI